MKRSITKIACILSLCFLLGAVAWAGDGQIDIAEIPYTISSSGSYIVVDDLSTTATNTHGITINADNVTLDLNGHAIIGPGKAAGGYGTGIWVNGTQYNIAVRNGTVRDWQWNGVNAINSENCQFEALRCYNNGIGGIISGACSIVSGNICRANEDYGINVRHGSIASGNTCRENGGNGIFAWNGSTVTGNSSSSNTGDGINTLEGCTVSGNTCQSNTGDGIQVSSDCRVVDNTCDDNGYQAGDGAGILATGSDNRINNNHCTDNDRGLDLDGADNIVSGNTLIGNTTPLDAVAGNQLDILISELPYTISQPGMYRLSGDLSLSTEETHGITIQTDNVTLDLNGHALTGPGKSAGSTGNGVWVNGEQYNIVVRNGTVRDWRQSGIGAGAAKISRFEALHCYNNGACGIKTWDGCITTGNLCDSNGEDGIYSMNNATVTGNICNNNGDKGIEASDYNTVSGNTCINNGGDGIRTTGEGTISSNTCSNNTGDGIESSNSLVSENCCMTNGTNYNLTSCTSVNNHP